MTNSLLETLAYAQGEPLCSGCIRTVPEDFVVDEDLGFTADGNGEHVLLHIRKRSTNTEWLAKQISQFAGVKQMDVSFAGLKDRNALTTQWFSIRLAGREEPDWKELNTNEITVLSHQRHSRKLRRGALKGNRFEITIRELGGHIETLEARLNHIKTNGVPNYFGEQRFGHGGNNLSEAEAMFKGKRIKSRHKRSLYLSAARSFLFNANLSTRVGHETWNRGIPGDVMMLSGSNSFFVAENIDAEIQRRIDTFDIHPSGPLCGRGQSPTQMEAAQLEQALVSDHPALCQGLKKADLKQARRPLRLIVEDLSWIFAEDGRRLVLKFFLPAGSYATSVLRELIHVQNEAGVGTD